MNVLANIVAAILTGVFFILAFIHIYWALGGRWGSTAAIPQYPDGRPLFKPGAGGCIAVALGLLVFGYVCLAYIGVTQVFGFARFIRWALLVMALIFLLRTIGDRRYCGLMRKITGTVFANYDRKFFTPLCFVLTVLLAILVVS